MKYSNYRPSISSMKYACYRVSIKYSCYRASIKYSCCRVSMKYSCYNRVSINVFML